MDIYSIGDGAFLEQVITAVTLVAGAGEFATMAKIGVLFGAILLLFQALTSGGRGINIAQLGVAGLLYALMFGGTQTVTITDAYTQEVRVVDNVPNGVAATGSFLTSIGYNLTELFETAFSTPTMTTQGYAFGLDVLKRVRMNSLTEFHLGSANAATPGSNFYESWSQYIKTCTLIGIELDIINKDDLFRTVDFLSALRFDSLNHAARIRIGGAPQTLICDVAFEALEGYTRTSFLPAFKQDVLPGVLDLDQPAGAAEVEQVIEDALNGLGVGPAPQSNIVSAAPPITADDFILSSVLVPIYYKAVRDRYVTDGNFSYADQLDDAVRARNSQWMANQSLFDRYLRPMLTFVEGFIFAATPILSLLIPIGGMGIGAAARFLLVGAWIQLWMPALAIVNLFLHDVVAGKLAALADAGTPLTSLAGLQQGDDIIQTWLATGGLMASAVPVLTLMLVYGGAISANFFATRLQGEDVVMERQAAGATFNPFEQLHVEPARTYAPTAGIAAQTGAEQRLDMFSYSANAGMIHESAADARLAASEQFETALRQSVSQAWARQESATVGQGFNQRIVAEGGQYEAALQRHFGDTLRSLEAETGMSNTDATQYIGSLAAGLGVLGSGTNVSGSDIETSHLSAQQHERLSTKIGDEIAKSDEVRASLSEAIAADVQGSTSDALLSSETLGSDETLSRSAQDVASASVAYNEAVRSGASMDASRNVSAKVLIPAVAANPDAARALNDVIVQNRLAGEVQLYENFHGDRDQDSFGGSAELAHLYAQAHVASQHVGDGDERSARIQAGLASAFQSAEGFGGYMGNSTMNAGVIGDAPSLGAAQSDVAAGLAAGPAGAPAFEHEMAGATQSIADEMASAIPAHQAHMQQMETQERGHLNSHNDRVLATTEAQERALETVELDGPIGTVNKAGGSLGAGSKSATSDADSEPMPEEEWISP